ncbi:MAG: DUF4445 domain-containing protein [Phycisphaerae bacterium]|nr:DUF4445 domain-containing protein [Phycisphaerae bacterium]
MTTANIKVTFEPTGRTVWVLPGTSVSEAAGRAGLNLDMPCGGTGVCGKCRVRFITGAPEKSGAGRNVLSEEELEAGWRLACQAAIETPAVVAIPETSLFADRLQILTESVRIVELSRGEPPHRKLPLSLVEGEANFAVAFDVGTTTLVGEMLELPGGGERAIAAGINPQVSFGDDVVSRIGRACTSPAAAKELQDAVVGAINTLIDELCESAGADRQTIRGISFSGNTTMQHLLLGLSVETLSRLPFAPARTASLEAPAEKLGFALAPGGRAWVMPVIGGFVGGDTTAGILSSRLDELEGPAVMIDIGTNGEIVLSAGGELYAASAAAGPAFEGARIACGMRAAAGAIEKVVFDGDLQTSVIGGVEPIGLCGSALVDITAELLRCGLLESTGRLHSQASAPAGACEALRRRLRNNEAGEPEFLLAAGTQGRPDVVLTQRDVRELQLAAGALRAGVSILLKQAGVQPGDLKQVLIAGGFGSFIRRSNAQRIGLIPAELSHEKISYVGNVSLHGAKWVLVSAAARERAEQIARRTKHVDLSSDANFQTAFAEAMIFPER